jgi:GNAT superfamily N-acetyltransferase
MIPAAVEFAVEPFRETFDEARPLLELHWDEIAKNKKLMTLNPDVKKYEGIVEALLLVTARAGGRLIGYFLWILVTHPHYKHVSVAEEDLHYLLPEYRRGLTGYLFMKAACNAALARGAQLLTMREKIGHEHPAIMKRLGFSPTDMVYTRTNTEAA